MNARDLRSIAFRESRTRAYKNLSVCFCTNNKLSPKNKKFKPCALNRGSSSACIQNIIGCLETSRVAVRQGGRDAYNRLQSIHAAWGQWRDVGCHELTWAVMRQRRLAKSGAHNYTITFVKILSWVPRCRLCSCSRIRVQVENPNGLKSSANENFKSIGPLT